MTLVNTDKNTAQQEEEKTHVDESSGQEARHDVQEFNATTTTVIGEESLPTSNVPSPQEPPSSAQNHDQHQHDINMMPSSSPNFRTSHPPPTCPDGGQWGVVKYIGNKTGILVCLGCFLGGICGLCMLACPQDEKDAYSVNGQLFDAAGVYMGLTKKFKFIPTRQS